jgi:hypothetical protein
MSDTLNPAPILAPKLDQRFVAAQSATTAQIVTNFNASEMGRPMPIPRNLYHRRLYFGVSLEGIQGPILRSRLVFSLEGQVAMILPVNVTGFDSRDYESQTDCLLPAWHVERSVDDKTFGRIYPDNLTNVPAGFICPDAMQWNYQFAATDGNFVLNNYRFTLAPLRLSIVADAVQWQVQSLAGPIIDVAGAIVGVVGVLSSAYPS